MTDIRSRFVVGYKGSFTKTVSGDTVAEFARVSGDTQLLHLDPAYGAKTRFQKQIAHGSLLVGFISTVLGVEMAGPDHTVVFLGMSNRFVSPVFLGDTVTAECEVIEVREDRPIVTLSCKCTNQNDQEVLTGEVTILIDPYPYAS